nr:hypothetical protein [uncultured Undibacterium sp.]
MQIHRFFLSDSQSLPLLNGEYNHPLVALSLFVAVLAGIMAFQLAGMARTEKTVQPTNLFIVWRLRVGIWGVVHALYRHAGF